MNLKSIKTIDIIKDFLGSELTGFQLWTSIGSIFIIWLLIQYMMKNLPKHRELNLTKNRNQLLSLKDLTELDWSSVNEVKALYIQSVLKETFGQALTIKEFINLSKFQNTIDIISKYLKFRGFYELNTLSGDIIAKPKIFNKRLGLYRKTWGNIFAVLFLSTISGVFGTTTILLLEKHGFSSNSALLIFEFSIVTSLCILLVIKIGYTTGDTKSAHEFLNSLSTEDLQTFPLKLSKSKIIYLNEVQ